MHGTEARHPYKRNFGSEDAKLPKRCKRDRAAMRGKDRNAAKLQVQKESQNID